MRSKSPRQKIEPRRTQRTHKDREEKYRFRNIISLANSYVPFVPFVRRTLRVVMLFGQVSRRFRELTRYFAPDFLAFLVAAALAGATR